MVHIIDLKFPKGFAITVSNITGIKPSPELGKIIRELKQKLVDGEISLSDNLEQYIKENYICQP